jgi:hypothetical protein
MAINLTQDEDFTFPITYYSRVENTSRWGETSEETTFQAYELNVFIKFVDSSTSQVAISPKGKEVRTEGVILLFADSFENLIDAGLINSNNVLLLNVATDYFIYKDKIYELLNIQEIPDLLTGELLVKIPFYHAEKNT